MKLSATVSLFLLVPVPSIGVLFGMILMPGTLLGQGVFILSKIWILLFPALWFVCIERERIPRGMTEKGGFKMGIYTGLGVCAFLVAMFLTIGQKIINADIVSDVVRGIGLDSKVAYIGAALGWIFVNSLLEEYVWRWFVVRQCAQAMVKPLAVVVSAFAFTLHHILATQVYFSGLLTLMSALCIFFAGVLWSWMFLRYKTIWPGWISHILVDISVFGIGYVLVFG